MRDLFKKRTVIGLIAILLSFVICFGITPLFNNALKAKTEVVKITKKIAKGEKITSDKITVAEVGKYNLSENVVKNKELVIGKYAKADLFEEDYILNSKISGSPIAENEYLCNFDGSKQAISITIKSFAAGLSGKLQTGDVVSIIASDYGELRETLIPKELEYVKVLAATTNEGADKDYFKEAKDDEEEELPSTVTLLVDKVQAKLLAQLEDKSKIHLSLIYRGSLENAKKFLDEQDKILNVVNTDASKSDSNLNNVENISGTGNAAVN